MAGENSASMELSIAVAVNFRRELFFDVKTVFTVAIWPYMSKSDMGNILNQDVTV